MNNFNQFNQKFADLILRKCLKDQEKINNKLLIMVDLKESLNFANIIKQNALQMGYEDVVIFLEDQDEIHAFLNTHDLDDIKNCHLFNRSILDEFAKSNNPIIWLDSRVPELLSDIDVEKLDLVAKLRSNSSSYYRANVAKRIFPWTLIRFPNIRWAQSIFSNDPLAYDKLYCAIAEACMLDTDDPIKEWDKFIEVSNGIKNNLNNLGINSLHFKNELGTDITIGLPEGYSWLNMDKGTNVINNMPSFEIFTTPDYRNINGVVYSSKPLFYLGSVIEDFYVEFKNGKVIDFDAKVGKELLNTLISDSSSSALGEVALVDINSPLASMNMNFNDTLYDENSSCHLAFGCGSPKSISGGDKMTKEELDKIGVNFSDIHVDFMIGTSDTDVYADSRNGKKLILRKGCFTDEVLKKL